MKEKVQELISHHKQAKEECWELLQELTQLSDSNISDLDKKILASTIIKTQEEYAWRGVFISNLENLLY